MARKKKYTSEDEEVSYWKSSMDVILSLLFIVLLILVLLAMWLVEPEVDDEGLADSDGVYSSSGYNHDYADDDDDDADSDDSNSHIYDYTGGGGGGGGAVNTSNYTGTGNLNGVGKCAILAIMRDAETGLVIKEKDVTFTLYNTRSGLVELYTYYPERIQYKDFQTTEEGEFFLPEKIPDGDYYFHELTEPEGYDAAADTYFSVARDYDWNEPLTVYIDLLPHKNTIQIQFNDTDDNSGVANAKFQIVAAEDIVTADGTVRYTSGEVVDTVTTDEQGHAETILLYLGNYTIRQESVPDGYVMAEDRTVEVKKKSSDNDNTEQMTTQKTTVTLTLTDELQTDIKLDGVTFELSANRGGTQRAVTDSNGKIVFTGLDKSTDYTLTQTTRYGEYQIASDAVKFTVDATGRIDGEATKTVEVTNRVLRLQVTVKDALLPTTISGYELTLYDPMGNAVGSWSSASTNYLFTGLEVGTYTISDNSNPDNKTEIDIIDTVDIQSGYYRIWTITDTAIVAVSVVAVIGIIGLVIALVLRRRRRKKDTNE